MGLTCHSCRFDFQPDEHWDGYCPSCGMEVPENSGPADDVGAASPQQVATSALATNSTPIDAPQSASRTPTSQVSVFSAQGAAKAADRSIGNVACLCGEEIAITANDYGFGVYCPRCGSEVMVGETLAQHAVPKATATNSDSASVTTQTQQRNSRVARGAAASVLIVLCCVVIVSIRFLQDTGTPSSSAMPLMSEGATSITPSKRDSHNGSNEETTDPDSPDDPTSQITLKAIERLLDSDDIDSALIEAQIWEDMLKDLAATDADDLRLKRLGEVITELQGRLTPPSEEPPKYVAEFRQLVRKMAKELANDNLTAARQAERKAAALIGVHPEELKRFAKQYGILRAKIQQAELQQRGLQEVNRLLAGSVKLAKPETITQALEQFSRARFMFRNLWVTDPQEKEIDRRAREVATKLKLPQAQRHVNAAQQCVNARDSAARNREVTSAKRILNQELPESQVRPLLAKLEKIAKYEIKGSSSSSLGQEFLVRDGYEKTLELFGRVSTLKDAAVLCAKCQEVVNQIPAPNRPNSATARKLSELAFEALEREVSALLAESAPEVDHNRNLILARTALTNLEPWKNQPRWKVLDVSMRQHEAELLKHAIDKASELADQDKLDEAIEAIEVAIALGTPATSREASQLRDEWQKERKLRADRQAQTNSWNRIIQLEKKGNVLEAWRALAVFAKRYRTNANKVELESQRKKLLTLIDVEVERRLRQIDGYKDMNQWKQFREALELLIASQLPGRHESQLSQLQDLLRQREKKANALFESLTKKQKLGLTTKDVLWLLHVLPQVLEITPDHAEANALLARAKELGKKRAPRLVKNAERYMKIKGSGMKAKAKQFLEEAIKLDPDGPSGKIAREYLKKL